jgi:pilus assembly protein CpaB
MRFSSILMFFLAILFGIAAVFMAQTWLEGQASLANRGPEAGGSLLPAKTVVVAAVPLRFGTELQAEHLREIEWPAGATPSGAYEKISDVLTSEGRRVVLSPIEASEPVLSWKVTGPGERATLSAVVDEGMRAMSVRINDVLGVAGFVLPGDRVDIMLTRDNYTDILLQNVKILAIGQLADERADKPQSAKTATIEVNSIDAQKLTLAQTVGSLSLALRAAGSVEAAAPRRVTLGDLGPAYEIYADAKDETEGDTAVDLLAKSVESGFLAVETKIKQMGEDFNKTNTQPLNTQAIPFDPNARVGVIRGMTREEYRVPKQNGDDGAAESDDGAAGSKNGKAGSKDGKAASVAASE